MTIFVNARAIIEQDSESGRQVLLQVRSRPGERECWELPGGQIDPFEPVLGALEREVEEETGLSLTLVHGQDERQVYEGTEATVETFKPLFAYQTLRGPVDSTGFYFRCQVEGKVTQIGDAAREPTWFSVEELRRRFECDADQFDWLTQAALERYLSWHQEAYL